MSVGTNIRRLRETAEMTQEQLAEKLDVARSTVTQWERGWSNPRMGMVQKIAGVFGVSTSDIVSDKMDVSPFEMLPVPILGTVHAGSPTSPDIIDGKSVLIPKFLIDEDPDCYALYPEGDCMNKVYPEDCVIIVSPNKPPQNGSVAVVSIDRSDYIMRRMYKTTNTLVLSPDSYNPVHKDIIISMDDDHTVEFGGKVVWFQSKEEMA